MKELFKAIDWKNIIIFISLSLLIFLLGIYYANHYLHGTNLDKILRYIRNI